MSIPRANPTMITKASLRMARNIQNAVDSGGGPMKTKAEHTKGPIAIENVDSAEGYGTAFTVKGGTEVIAMFNPAYEPSHANLNLWKAAPDLLEALEDLAVQLEESHLHVPPVVRAAIRKARGETA